MADLRSIVICIGSFLIQFVVFGISNNFGLVYYHIRREYHGTETETGKLNYFITVTFPLVKL